MPDTAASTTSSSGWGGRHPLDRTTVMVSHRRPHDRPEDDENFVFVTSGVEDAVARARELAGDRDVGVNGGEIARQCFDAGLLDEVHIDLVPVFLGTGIPLLGLIRDAPVELEGPFSVVEGEGVTHLGYRVIRT